MTESTTDAVGVTPEEFARVWDSERNVPLVPVSEISDEEFRLTPLYLDIKASLGKGLHVSEELIFGIVRPAAKETYKAAQSSLKVERMQRASLACGASVLPLFEAAAALGLAHEGKLSIYQDPGLSPGGSEGWAARAGGLFGTALVAQCFIVAGENGLEHKGHLVAEIKEDASGVIVGSIKLPGKRGSSTGTAHGPKFRWKDYRKLVGYGDDPESEAGQLAQHDGFIIQVVRKVDGSVNTFELKVTLNDDGKGVLSLYSYMEDGSPQPVIRCTEGRGKKASPPLIVSDSLLEVTAPSNLCPKSALAGGKTPWQEFDLKTRIAEIEADSAEETSEETSAPSGAAALLGDDA